LDPENHSEIARTRQLTLQVWIDQFFQPIPETLSLSATLTLLQTLGLLSDGQPVPSKPIMNSAPKQWSGGSDTHVSSRVKSSIIGAFTSENASRFAAFARPCLRLAFSESDTDTTFQCDQFG
jgi:hypothetical protein